MGWGDLTPKLAIPFTTLSAHLRISGSPRNRFTVGILTPRWKNNRRIMGIKTMDGNRQPSQRTFQLPTSASRIENTRFRPHFAHSPAKRRAIAFQIGLRT
ncbi:MAG: hypothetical protein ACTSSA_13380 [Candidatus Freyarchaeota archaeon]